MRLSSYIATALRSTLSVALLFATGACELVGMQTKSETGGGNLHQGNGSLDITGVSPNQGVLSGGTTIMISGSGFTPDSMVEIDGFACDDLEYFTPRLLKCSTPSHEAGQVQIEVWDRPDGESVVMESGFNYVATSAPTLSIGGVSPSSGSVAGGNQIQISGIGFKSGATVMIDNFECTNPSVAPATITCTVPSNVKRVAELRVQNPDGETAFRKTGYTYNSGTITYNILSKVVFVRNCIGCHGTNGRDGVSLNTYNGARASVNLSNPANSILYTAVKEDANGEADMPEGGNPIPQEEQAAILQWIQAGAPN